jgi:hypothetical protein
VNSGWITGNLYWLVPSLIAVIGGFATLIYWLLSSKPTNPSVQQTTRPTITQSPIITQTSSPVTNVIVSSTPSPPPRTDRITRPSAITPNIKLIRSRTVKVLLDSADAICETDRDSDYSAVIACFRNESRDEYPTADADYVTASAIFRNSSGHEIEGLTRLVWLNEVGDMVDFGVNDRHCVILVVVDAHGRFFAPFKRRIRTTGGDEIEPEVYNFKEEIATVELKLLSDGNPLVRTITFDCSLEDGVPSAVPRDKGKTVREAPKPAEQLVSSSIPQVVVSCDWPPQKGPGEISGVSVVLNRPFILRNLSDVPAANVQIQEITRQTGKVRFSAVSLLEKGKDVQLVPIVTSPRGVGVRDFENILQDETPDLLSAPSLDALTIKLPIRVSYMDLHGNRFESLHELEYELYDRVGQIKPQGIKKI